MFVFVLFLGLIFQTFLAVFTQAFGIFYYPVILAGNLIFVAIILFYFFKKYQNFNFKIDWMLLLVLVISVLSLWQVHYNYTGEYSMVNDKLFQYHQAKNMQYVYPYFSDEWYAVALVKNAITNHSLPLQNPFDGSFFLNLELFFHSFISEIMVLFGLDPLTQYTLLSVFINTLIIVLAYLFLRICNVSKPVSAISSLSILYIASSANLPGIWNLIPVTMGVVFSLIGFCFIAQGRKFLAILAGIFVLLFYPPLIIFYGLGLLVYFLPPENFLVGSKTPALFQGILMSNLFYKSFTGNFIPQFNFYYVIPWWAIIFSVAGLGYVYKDKKWMFWPVILGIILWVFYIFSFYRIVIGYERVVYFTSILVCIVSGFGLEWLNSRIKFLKHLEVLALMLFFLFVPFYTQGENWKTFILRNPEAKANSIPMATANNYLTNDDLRIFKNIKNKKFFSMPWKGTVIGTATDNYPVVTKGGTITMDSQNPAIYQEFLNSDCGRKEEIIKQRSAEYVYSASFSCPGFEKIDESSEGFVLYVKRD